MTKNRLEAFSDGVIAIIITIMVLELKIPHGDDFHAFQPIIPEFISYVLSFIYIGIYWNNHHHLLQAIQTVNGKVLWANMHLLFWLSLVPFLTSWMGENNFARVPVALYGVDLLGAAIAYEILTHSLINQHSKHSSLARAHGRGTKEKISILLYAIAIPLAFIFPIVSYVLYIVVAAMWLMPDRRIENLDL